MNEEEKKVDYTKEDWYAREVPGWKNRHTFFIGYTIAVIIAYILINPDLGIIQNLGWGADFTVTVVSIGRVFVFVGLLNLSVKASFDWLVFMKVYNRAMENPIGAGLVWLGMAVVFSAVAQVIAPIILS